MLLYLLQWPSGKIELIASKSVPNAPGLIVAELGDALRTIPEGVLAEISFVTSKASWMLDVIYSSDPERHTLVQE